MRKAPKPTLAAVAGRAGVSAPTVSKVLNGRTDVSAETRARVVRALEEAGYESPRQRRAARTVAVGPPVVEILIGSLGSGYMTEILDGLLDYAVELGIETVVSKTAASGTSEPSAQRPTPETRARRMVEEGRRGLLVVTPAVRDSQLNAFLRRKIPVVVIDPHNTPSDVVSVGATDWAGGKSATEHLIELGHRRIAFVGGAVTVDCNLARLHGYLAALMAAGIPVDEQYIVNGQFHAEHGVRGLTALLSLGTPPTAIFAANDLIASGILAGARRSGIAIPRDLSVVGFDGSYLAEESVPRLTTVNQPLNAIARAALDSLLRQIKGEPFAAKRTELATKLVVRDSTAPPATTTTCRATGNGRHGHDH
ncbi:LacI family transcriptional regulator [Streptomyces montanus]|uniref:LacI family transcriptional regulator n=1 Tax=Streptomyces montanus TaxID=2580423 RepID=A0A5R9FM80_9ACTN|nr:LacI family transcriptional regulator [Streptomyces montanus]